MEIRLDHLEQGFYYHIFNRGINSCKVFENDDNRLFFLKKAKEYLLPVADVYAYCLMPNHFHFLLRIKDDFENFAKVPNFGEVGAQNTPKFKVDGLHSEQAIASKQIGKLISSYTQAFNKYHHRHGSLFERPFKRLRIDSEEYLRKAIVYIHRNALDIGEKMEDYHFSSYKGIIGNSKSAICKKEVIELFEDVENLKWVHQIENDYEF